MFNLLITLLVPLAVSSYFVYQVSLARGQSPILWLAINVVIPFSPLIYFVLYSGEKLSTPYAKSLEENAVYSAPIALRPYPERSRASVRGWLYITRESLYWIPLDSEVTKQSLADSSAPQLGILQWELKDASLENKSIYRDGIVNLMLLPPPMDSAIDRTGPVALVLGTGISVGRVAGLATIISRSQED